MTLGVPNWHAWVEAADRADVPQVQARALDRVARALRSEPTSDAGQAVRAVLTVLEIQARARLDECIPEPDPLVAERVRQELRGLLDVYQMLIPAATED